MHSSHCKDKLDMFLKDFLLPNGICAVKLSYGGDLRSENDLIRTRLSCISPGAKNDPTTIAKLSAGRSLFSKTGYI